MVEGGFIHACINDTILSADNDTLSIHSSLGYVLPQSYQQYPQHSSSFRAGPTHQPTFCQPSDPGYPPPGHQYPTQQGYYHGHSPPPQPTSSSHHTSLPPHQYTGAQVQELSCQGNRLELQQTLTNQ